MNFLLFATFCTVITVPICADWAVISLVPNGTISTTIHDFQIEINRTVNRPAFSSNITIRHNSSNSTILPIDVHMMNDSVMYSNQTLKFSLPTNHTWNMTNEYYITFDAGVLFSDDTSNSSARTDLTFWFFTVIEPSTSSLPSTVDIRAHSDTSTDGHAKESLEAWTGQQSTTTERTAIAGEQSPGQSARIGMGLGITFIAIILIVEIIFCKYFYSGSRRSPDYYR